MPRSPRRGPNPWPRAERRAAETGETVYPAISNIALPAYDHAAELGRLRDLGMEGLEVAPSRVWRDTWHGLTAADVSAYRHAVETAGLRVVGLHSLFFDQPDLGLFKAPEIRRQSLDFLEHLSAVCRDLGGRTLIYRGRCSKMQSPRQKVSRRT